MLTIRNIGCILLQAVLSLKINTIFCAFDWGKFSPIASRYLSKKGKEKVKLS